MPDPDKNPGDDIIAEAETAVDGVAPADSSHSARDAARADFVRCDPILRERRYPLSGGTVYHYCSASTLLAILQNKTLRFSDLSRLNDAEEQVWGYKRVFLTCLGRIEAGRGVPVDFPHVSPEFINSLKGKWDKLALSGQPFVCCFSTDGDSLSQWRAYASDGEGFAIGFARNHLRGLPAQALAVQYSPETQIAEMFDALKFIWSILPDPADWSDDNYLTSAAALTLIMRSTAYKNPAFRDEREIRSVFRVRAQTGAGGRILQSSSGYVEDKATEPLKVQFESRRGIIVPYVDMPFSPDHTRITHINIGPRARNTEDEIRQLIRTLGLEDVQIDVAGSQYR